MSVIQCRLGMILPAESPSDSSGEEALQGAQLALALNANPGISLAFRMVHTPAGAADAVEDLVDNDEVECLTGSIYTALADAIRTAAAAHNKPFWEVAAIADHLTANPTRPVIRTGPRAASYGEMAAQLLDARGAPAGTPLLLYENSAFGNSLAAGLSALMPVRAVPLAPEGGDIDAALAAILENPPEALFAACYTVLARRLWQRLHQMRPDIRLFLGVGGGWLHLEKGDPPLSGTGAFVVDTTAARLLNAGGLSPETRRFRERYRAAYSERFQSEPTVYSDLAFVGTDLLVRRVLPNVERLDAAELRRAVRGIDLGAGGTILGFGAKFNEAGDNLAAFPVVSQWRVGRLPVVFPPSLATESPDWSPPFAPR